MKIAVLLFSLFMGLFCSVAFGEAEKKAKTEIIHKTQDLDKVKAELKRKREETERLKREAAEISENLKRNESKMKNVQQTMIYTMGKSRQVQSQLASTKNERDRLVQDIGKNQDGLKQSMQIYFVASSLMGPSSSVPVYTRRAIYGEAEKLRVLNQKRDQSDSALTEIIQVQRSIRQEVERQESLLTKMKSNLKDQEKQLEKKMTRQQIVASELRDLQQTAQELASLIDVLRTKAVKDEEAQRQARLSRQQSGESPISSHSLPWPVKGVVVEKFGRQTNKELGTPYISNGITIHSQQSQTVQAVADGNVLYAGQFMSYGSIVLVEHSGDWYTVYGKLFSWSVEKGQAIKAGDGVGKMNGIPGGAETYFEMRFYGKPTDPLPWLVP